MNGYDLEEQWLNGNRTFVVNYFQERLAVEPQKTVLEMLVFNRKLTPKEQDGFRLLWRKEILS